MRYYYENYCFDLNTLTLYQNNEPQALKANEAKLLAFFIDNKTEILSKEQILNEIWGQQSVSEQVVFQNVSQLRSLFGMQAIKTFPKKGYQWQLAFEVREDLQGKLVTSSTIVVKSSSNYLLLAIGLFLLCFAAVIFWLFPKDNSINTLYLIPFALTDGAEQSQVNDLNELISKSSSSLDTASEINTLSLFNYPESTRQVLNLANDSIIVSGYLSAYDDQLLLEYRLLGAKRAWSGYLMAQDVKSLVSQLIPIVTSLKNTRYLSEENSAILSAKLRLLLDKKPNNQAVIYHLLQLQVREQNYNVAKALTEKLLTLNEGQLNSPYLALGFALKAAIYHQQQNFKEALKYYNQSLAQLTDNRFLEIKHKVEISLAWLSFAQKNNEKMQQHISNAALYAQQNKDVLAQVSAQTTGSILSHKLGDMINRYKYLNTGKSLLITHKVEEAHFAIIHYHLALFASDKKEAESYYLKVLSLPKSTQYQWLYESATEDLLSWYIEQKQWQAAASLFLSQPKSSFNLNQRAKLLHATKDYPAAIDIAKRAFDQARLNYQHNNALHAALLLYQLHAELHETYTVDYQNYISENASKFWLNKHKDELRKLGYFDGLSK